MQVKLTDEFVQARAAFLEQLEAWQAALQEKLDALQDNDQPTEEQQEQADVLESAIEELEGVKDVIEAIDGFNE